MNKITNLKQQTKKPTFKWYSIFGYFALWLICYTLGQIFLFEILKLNPDNDKGKLMIGETILITFVHLLDFVFSWIQNYELTKWAEEKILQKETETKQIIQKQTEQLKKELLETKTELLLNQNKLRDCQEKSFHEEEKSKNKLN